jgi:arylsulfatase A-like enzyme
MPYSHSQDARLRTITGDELRAGGVTGSAFRASVRKAYDDEVVYNDREIGRLLDALDKRGFFASGIAVLTADHGEELWEHGGIEHGHSHHREVTEIPLLIVAPGLEPGPRSGVASLVDLAPTLKDMAGIESPGLDLRRAIEPARIATTFGNLYGGTMRSARDAGERVIGSRRGIDGEKWERFDLGSDPGEQSALPVDPAGRVYGEARALEPPAAGKSAGVNRDALKALGYVQ